MATTLADEESEDFDLERGNPFTFKFKISFNLLIEFQSVNVIKKSAARPVINLVNIQQCAHNPSRRIVTEAKKKDMLNLFSYIIPVYHHHLSLSQ